MSYYDILLAKKLNEGSGGDITVEGLSVTENGTYTAPSGKAFSPVVVNVSGGSGDSIERLCDVVYVWNDTEEIPVLDAEETTFDTNFSDYVSYDSTTGKFTVLQGFSALVIPWTYEAGNATGSYAHGEFYINDTKVKGWTVDYKSEGYYAGIAFTHTFAQGDTFYNYTPNSDGFPQQMLRLYKIKSLLTNLFDEMFSFKSGEFGGIGRVISY